jgi:molybdopterin-binding protein
VKLSARNMLKGTVIDVKKGQVVALVRLDIGGGVVVTASITNTAVEDLKLTIGQPAYAVIKSSDVIIAVD